MPKKLKQSKTSKITRVKRIKLMSLLGFEKFNRRPLLAGLAVALFVISGGFMAAQAKSEVPASELTGQIDAVQDGVGDGSVSKTQVDKARAASTDKNSSQDKMAAEAEARRKAEAQRAAAAQAQAAAAKKAGTPAPAPAPPPPANVTGLHENVTVTIFWIGEDAGPDNANISNAESAWDGDWEEHYGGYDDPDNRNGYYPAGFTPQENPFYFALPYNDLDNNGDRKTTASNCPKVTAGAVSWCKNAWIKIIKNGKTAYAQWQDVGPLGEDDVSYVFGSAQPSNTWGAKAGLDVSPAVRDYLGLSGVDTVSWAFVAASAVPDGPWKAIVTSSPGGW